MKKLFVFAIAILGFTAVSFGQSSATSLPATASATIIGPISIAKNTDLNFGNIVNTSGGTVAIDAITSVRSPSAGVTLPTSLTGTVSAAQFTITGETGTTYNITTLVPITITDGGTGITHNMTVGTFVPTAASGTLGTLTGGAGTTSTQVVKLGATLTVNANQAVGVYTNTTDLKMTVNYN